MTEVFRSNCTKEVIDAIEEVFEVEIVLLSIESTITDFLSGIDEDFIETRMASLSAKLGVPVFEADTIPEIVERMLVAKGVKLYE